MKTFNIHVSKLLMFGFALLISTEVFAIGIYTIRWSNASLGQIGRECSKDQEIAAAKLKVISERLSPGQENLLSVQGTYGSSSSGGYCYLDFETKDPTLSYKETSSPLYIRLSRSNWEAACMPEYETALANQNSPNTMMYLGWTLVQGRFCQVTSIEVEKAK